MLILEFTQDRIKLLEAVRRGRKLSLIHLAKKAVSGLSDDEVASSLEALLKETGVKKRRPLVACVPRHLFTIKYIRLPSANDLELRGMAGLQVGKLLPYPAGDLIWDFRALEKRPDGYSDVALVLGHKGVVDRFSAILHKARLEADRIVSSTEALFVWYLALKGAQPAGDAPDSGTALIDVDTSHIDIIVLRGDILEFSRCFSARDDLDEIVDEITRTLYSYKKDKQKDISRIVMTGIEDKAAGLKARLGQAEAFSKTPMEFIHPLKIISGEYPRALAAYEDSSRDASFISVLGAAYNLPEIKMNFLPSELKEARAKKERRSRLFVTLALFTGVIVAVSAIFAGDMIARKKVLDSINLRIRDLEPKVKLLRQTAGQIEIVKENLDIKGSAIDVMREIYKTAPGEISITVLDFELGKSVTIRGISGDLNSIFKFASNLDKSDYFEKYEIKYAQKRIVKEKEFVDFEITCKLSRLK
ncbi:MAG: PilN domain-containing protein [Candidatus Omnitrophica bacterium]|nr:PilN domain-containing protein [Candidatus Omnitrophota bacterium]